MLIKSIQAAAERLNQGELVAFPTETVFGLGADAENIQAVSKIYQIKERPTNHPVIVHVAPDVDLSYWAKNIPHEAEVLIKAFWPGPLTLILERADHIPDAVSGGQSTVGLRCPSHPTAQALLTEFAKQRTNGQGGVAAPSANKFGQVSPTQSQHVMSEFKTRSPVVSYGYLMAMTLRLVLSQLLLMSRVSQGTCDFIATWAH